MGDKIPSSLGGVVGLVSAISFGQWAEFRSPGLLTTKIRKELSLKISFLLVLVGVLPVYMSNAEAEDPLSKSTLLIIFIFAYILSFGIHYLGLGQGARIAKRNLEAIAKKKENAEKSN